MYASNVDPMGTNINYGARERLARACVPDDGWRFAILMLRPASPSLTEEAAVVVHYYMKPRPPAVDAFRLCRCGVPDVCTGNK